MKTNYSLLCLTTGILIINIASSTIKLNKKTGINMNDFHMKMSKSILDERLSSFSNGAKLRNHYGYKSDDSPYGKESGVDVKRLMMRKQDMTWTKPVINSIDPAGLVGDDCDLKGGQFYEHCRAISECHLCNNNPVCRWCPSTNKCNPGVKPTAYCPFVCPYSIESMNNNDCLKNLKVFGSIKHVSPYSKGMRSPEIAKPKWHQHTKTTEIQMDRTKVFVGNGEQRIKMSYQDKGNNKLETHWTTQRIPLYQDISIPKLVDKQEDKWFDQATNNQIVQDKHTESAVMHGFNSK